MIIFGIDPGEKESGTVTFDFAQNKLIGYRLWNNTDLIWSISHCSGIDTIVFEDISSYGMPVGKETFETVFWIGRFYQEAVQTKCNVDRISRKDVKLHLCNTTRAKDSNIRQSIIDRFGIPGTKKAPGILYGMKAHLWPALAVAITYYDNHKRIPGAFLVPGIPK